MPLIWGVLSRLIFTRAGAWLLSALAWIGIGLAVQGTLVGPALEYVQDALTGLPASIASWLGFLNIDKYFTIVGSAYVAGTVKRVILRKVLA